MFFVFLSTISQSMAGIFYKDLVGRNEKYEIIVLSSIMSAIISAIGVIGNFHIEYSFISIGILGISVCLKILTTWIYISLVKCMELYKVEAVTKLYLILVLFLDIFFIGYSPSIINILGIVVMFIGIYLIQVKKESSPKHISSNKGKVTFLIIVGCLAWAIKPFIIRYGFENNLFNTETNVLIDTLMVAIVYMFKIKGIKRPSNIMLLKYSGWGLCKYFQLVFYNVALMSIPVTIVSVVTSSSIIFITIFTAFFFKTKITLREFFGVVIGFIGILFMTNRM